VKSTHVAPFKHVPDEQPVLAVVTVVLVVDVTLVVRVPVVVVVRLFSHRTPENPATHEQLNPYGRAWLAAHVVAMHLAAELYRLPPKLVVVLEHCCKHNRSHVAAPNRPTVKHE